MSEERIIIKESGVTILGFPIGFEPTIRDFELAFEGESLRTYRATNQMREQRICDAKGIRWLNDLTLNSVFWLNIVLGPIRDRKVTDADTVGFFRGKIDIGKYSVQGPFSFEIAEIVRKVTIPGLEIRLIPDTKRIRALTVAFQENEGRTKVKQR